MNDIHEGWYQSKPMGKCFMFGGLKISKGLCRYAPPEILKLGVNEPEFPLFWGGNLQNSEGCKPLYKTLILGHGSMLGIDSSIDMKYLKGPAPSFKIFGGLAFLPPWEVCIHFVYIRFPGLCSLYGLSTL